MVDAGIFLIIASLVGALGLLLFGDKNKQFAEYLERATIIEIIKGPLVPLECTLALGIIFIVVGILIGS